jgi:hypothetical protein
VKDVVLGATTTVGLQVCFQGTGHPSADLQMCTASAAPCISSLRVVGAGVKVALVIPPGDPRWKIDGVVSATESPAGIPSTAAVGTKIKITGTDLLGPNGQTVPSVGFTSVVGSTVTGVVVSATSTAIKVKVPNGAASGPVTLVWPQVAEAPAVTATSSTVKIT